MRNFFIPILAVWTIFQISSTGVAQSPPDLSNPPRMVEEAESTNVETAKPRPPGPPRPPKDPVAKPNESDVQLPPMIRRRLQGASPEERRRIVEAYQKLKEMPKEERNKLQFGMDRLKKEVRKDAEEAYEAIGLRLSEEDKALFLKRYVEERRRLERSLMQQAREAREKEIPLLHERLREEFSKSTKPGA